MKAAAILFVALAILGTVATVALSRLLYDAYRWLEGRAR